MSDPQVNLKSIFNHALELGPEVERPRYLDEACGDDDVLRAEVEALLQAHAHAAGFLDEPSSGWRPVPDTAPLAGADAVGTRIGRYKLLERIGEGGFGVVFMAEQQQPIRRKVAL